MFWVEPSNLFTENFLFGSTKRFSSKKQFLSLAINYANTSILCFIEVHHKNYFYYQHNLPKKKNFLSHAINNSRYFF